MHNPEGVQSGERPREGYSRRHGKEPVPSETQEAEEVTPPVHTCGPSTHTPDTTIWRGGAFQIRADVTEGGRRDSNSTRAESATKGPNNGQYTMGTMVSGGAGEEGYASYAGHFDGHDG